MRQGHTGKIKYHQAGVYHLSSDFSSLGSNISVLLLTSNLPLNPLHNMIYLLKYITFSFARSKDK